MQTGTPGSFRARVNHHSPQAAMPSGKPFVLLSAVGAAVAVLLAALRHPNRGRSRLPAVLTAAGAVGIALLTTGWNGFVLASPWTLAVAGLALLTGWLTRPDGK